MKITTNTPQPRLDSTKLATTQMNRPTPPASQDRFEKLDRASGASGRLSELNLMMNPKGTLTDLGPESFGFNGPMPTTSTDPLGMSGDGFGMTSDPRQKGDAGDSLSSNGDKSFADHLSNAFNAGIAALGAAAGMGSNLGVNVGVIAGAGTAAEIAASAGAVGIAGAAGVAVGTAIDAGITAATGKPLGDHIYEAVNGTETAKPETQKAEATKPETKKDATMPHEGGSGPLPKGMTVPPSRIERTGMTTRKDMATRETDAHGDRLPFDQSLIQDRLTRRLTNPAPEQKGNTDKARVKSSEDGLRRSLDNVILPNPNPTGDRDGPIKKKTFTGSPKGGLK